MFRNFGCSAAARTASATLKSGLRPFVQATSLARVLLWQDRSGRQVAT